MGWKLKILAFIVALVAIPFRAWIITIPLLIYVLIGFIPRRKKQQQVVVQMVSTQYQVENPSYAPVPHTIQPLPIAPPSKARLPGKTLARYLIGSIFLILGLIAAGAGGTFAPLVFGGMGVLLVLWGPFSRPARISVLKPAAESILLRTKIPFLWIAMAEVKLVTQQPARPISSIGERLLVFASESPTIYLVLQRIALDHRGAEEKILSRMREIAKATAPLGAYILPLDSVKVAERLDISLQDLKIDPETWKQNLSMVHYDILAIESKEGHVKSFAAYMKDGSKPPGRPRLPSVGKRPSRPPLLYEMLYPIGTRVHWASPDAYTAFLSSMAATENATIGERIIDTGSAVDSQILRVRSVGSPAVELSRAELRAIVRVYTPPVKEGIMEQIAAGIRV
jgi:hypothetical protein